MAEGVDKELPAPPLPPPPSSPKTTRTTQHELQTASGASVCSATRPDLTQVFIGLRSASPRAPEDRLLIRSWFQAEFETNTDGTDALGPVSTRSCADYLVCAWLPKDRSQAFIVRFVEFLSRVKTGSFYPARSVAMDLVEEQRQRSAVFRLSSLAEALVDGRAERWGAGVSQVKVLDAYLGAPRLLQLSPPTLFQALLKARADIQVTVLAPSDPSRLAELLKEELKKLPPSNTSRSAGTMAKSSAQRPLLAIDDARYPWSTLYISWPELPQIAPERTAVLLKRLQAEVARLEPSIWSEIHEGDALIVRPALLLRGQYEQLLELAPQIRARATALPGALTAQLPKKALPPSPPCEAPQASEAALDASELKDPQMLLWGAHQSEESPEHL